MTRPGPQPSGFRTKQQPILTPSCGLPPTLLPRLPPSPKTHHLPETGALRAEEEKRDHGLHLVRRPGALRLPLPPLRLPRVRARAPLFHAFLAHPSLRSRLVLASSARRRIGAAPCAASPFVFLPSRSGPGGSGSGGFNRNASSAVRFWILLR